MTEGEMVGWHHWLNAHEFEQAPGDSEGQESPVCCSPWGHKEPDTTERQWDNDVTVVFHSTLNCIFELCRISQVMEKNVCRNYSRRMTVSCIYVY